MTDRMHLAPARDGEAARWLASALGKPRGRGPGVTIAAAVIPRGYEAYVRLFHPAWLAGEGREITWTETAAHVRLGDRGYFLLRGDVRAAVERLSPPSPQHASVWWPEDRAWCVATDVDMMWTYVGGSEACIGEIVADRRLEAWRASPDDRTDAGGDEVNAPRCSC